MTERVDAPERMRMEISVDDDFIQYLQRSEGVGMEYVRADIHAAMAAELVALRAENEDLKACVLAFAVPWATQYGYDHFGSNTTLHPEHYDLLERCGGRMDDFVRAEIGGTHE